MPRREIQINACTATWHRTMQSPVTGSSRSKEHCTTTTTTTTTTTNYNNYYTTLYYCCCCYCYYITPTPAAGTNASTSATTRIRTTIATATTMLHISAIKLHRPLAEGPAIPGQADLRHSSFSTKFFCTHMRSDLHTCVSSGPA